MGVNVRGVIGGGSRPSYREQIENTYPQMKAYYAYASEPKNNLPHNPWNLEITPRELEIQETMLKNDYIEVLHDFDRNKAALDQVIAAKLLSAGKLEELKDFIQKGVTVHRGNNNEITVQPESVPEHDIIKVPLQKIAQIRGR